MILVTVGTDGPFNRLVKTVDEWATRNQRHDVFAQIGEGGWKPGFIRSAEFLEPPDFRRFFQSADLIVAHAGMGTILSALRFRKPLVVMPRRASLGEQRNEHQLATARHLAALRKVEVAFDDDELIRLLDNRHRLTAREAIGDYADEQLQSSIREFIWQEGRSPAKAPLAGFRKLTT